MQIDGFNQINDAILKFFFSSFVFASERNFSQGKEKTIFKFKNFPHKYTVLDVT